MKQEIKENEVLCDCGIIIKGNSKAHALSLLPEHKRSKVHKERMEAIKSQRKN